MKLPEDNLRLICEIEYRVGLIHMMLSTFDDSIAAFKRACEILDAEIDLQKNKNENADRTAAVVKELEELKVDILNKIVEVEEAKQQVLIVCSLLEFRVFLLIFFFLHLVDRRSEVGFCKKSSTPALC